MAKRLPTRLLLILAILWRTSLFVLAFALLSALFIVPFAGALSEWRGTYPIQTQLYFDIAGAGAMFAATWIMTRFVDHRPFQSIGLSPDHLLRDLAIGLAVGTAWLLVSVGSAWLAGWASSTIPSNFSGIVLVWAAISLFFNVLTQQMLLCGYIFQTIRSRTNFILTLLISAALFSTYHAGAFQGSWLPVLNVFAAGALFCLAYNLTGNLWLPIAVHFAWNLLLGPVLGLTVSGSTHLGAGWTVFAIDGPALFTGGSFGLEGGLIVTLTTSAFIVAIVLYRRRRQLQDARLVQGVAG